jgi:hypothetical protein
MTDLAQSASRQLRGPARKRSTVTASTVSATQLGAHLDLTRQRISALAHEGVLVMLPDGRYDQDDARVRYLRWLRDPARRSARTEAAAEFTAAKSELIRLRLAEKKKLLMPTSEHDRFVEELVSLLLTKLSGWPARIGGTDLALRRKGEALVFELRTEIADACQQKADEYGEPPEDDA